MDHNWRKPGDGHGHRGDHRRTFIGGYWWPYGGSWTDYTSGGYDSEEPSPAYAAAPEPVAAPEPPCPELLHWSAKLGKVVRYRLCDDPGAASLTE